MHIAATDFLLTAYMDHLKTDQEGDIFYW